MAIKFVDIEPEGEPKLKRAAPPKAVPKPDGAPAEAAPALPLPKPEPKSRGRKKPLR